MSKLVIFVCFLSSKFILLLNMWISFFFTGDINYILLVTPDAWADLYIKY